MDLRLSAFLLKVNEVGETAHNDFRTSRVLEKSAKLFDTIQKTRTSQKTSSRHKEIDIAKETKLRSIKKLQYCR